MNLAEFGFGQPWWLLLLLPLFWWFRRMGKTGQSAAILHSTTSILAKIGTPRRATPGKVLKGFRFFSLTLLVLAMARPRLPEGEHNQPNKGIDIMLACDISGSMDEEDFSVGIEKISRREALTRAISEFVENRTSDRIGMVGFGQYTYLLSPLTTDGNWIKDVLKMVELRMDGTAVGDGIIAGVDKLEEDSARSKVMILVTDGQNNKGNDPLVAADYAKDKGVRIYALEIMGLRSIRGAGVEKRPLAQVAKKTGGQYFQASDTGSLMQIYRQIDRMEKREIEVNRHMLYNELFMWFVGIATALLLFEWIANHTFWLRVP